MRSSGRLQPRLSVSSQMSRCWRKRVDLLPFMTAGMLSIAMMGCGGRQAPYVPVSGVVLLNAAPLADAKLVFEPIGLSASSSPGMPSYGRTDAEGRFELTCPGLNRQGAVVGEHRVRIMTSGLRTLTAEQLSAGRKKLQKQEADAGNPNAEITDEQVRDFLSDTMRMNTPEKLPARYNRETELTFLVSTERPIEAKFELSTP